MGHVDEEQQVLGAQVAYDVAGVLLEDRDHIGGTEQPDDREDVPSDHNGHSGDLKLRCGAHLHDVGRVDGVANKGCELIEHHVKEGSRGAEEPIVGHVRARKREPRPEEAEHEGSVAIEQPAKGSQTREERGVRRRARAGGDGRVRVRVGGPSAHALTNLSRSCSLERERDAFDCCRMFSTMRKSERHIEETEIVHIT